MTRFMSKRTLSQTHSSSDVAATNLTSVAIRHLFKSNDEYLGVRTVAFFPKCTQITYTEFHRTDDKAE